MDSKQQQDEETQISKSKEKQIPVFTVLKNNSILKNIFLVDTPPPIPNSSTSTSSHSREEAGEETLLVGRHPDCNITLEHPSISRFHLRIHCRPSSKTLSVIDLSSVHGTWVSGNKIESGVQVEMNEGDTLRLGVSSRIYRLHWIPLSHAYDFENPFMPPIDEFEPVEESELGTNQTRTLDDNDPEGVVSLFSDMNINAYSEEQILSASTLHEGTNQTHTLDDDDSGGFGSLFSGMNIISSSEQQISSASTLWEGSNQTNALDDDDSEGFGSLFSGMNIISCSEQQILSASTLPEVPTSAVCGEENLENTATVSQQILNASPMPVDMTSSFCGEENAGKNSPVRHCLEENEDSQLLLCSQPDKENSSTITPHAAKDSKTVAAQDNLESHPLRPVLSSAPSIWSRRGKPASVYIETDSSAKRGTSCTRADYDVIAVNHENSAIQSISKDLFHSVNVNGKEEEEAFTPDKENHTPNTLLLKPLKKVDKENVKNESVPKSFALTENGDDELFTPDKKNMTPNTLLLKSLKTMGKLVESKHDNQLRSSPLKNVAGPNVPSKNQLIPMDCKNETMRVLQEQNYLGPHSSYQASSVLKTNKPKCKSDRIPFQSLLVDSPSKGKISVLNDSGRGWEPDNLLQINPIQHGTSREENKMWTMVVDSACLVDKESRKALQLLQGIKRTKLIIPRIVIRELDCMNRRGNLFKRTSEASSALQWIEDCMVNTDWWIHVQNAEEEVRLMAPTPPITPLAGFNDRNNTFAAGWVPFSPSGSLLHIISPTFQDHILECALSLRRITDGHLILLSDDVSLKIKAMSEGLLCETAEHFRESLTNPFSERFLWTDSSPRGPTWCCEDDIVLREKYYPGPLKKLSKAGEGVKGLKLILLHNSHYRQKTCVSSLYW